MMNKPILWMNKLDTQIFGYLFGYLPPTSLWQKSTVVMASQVVVVSNNLNDLNIF